MSLERFLLLRDLRTELRYELAKSTASTSSCDFPETFECFQGTRPEPQFMILQRNVRLNEIEFVLESGSFPVVTHHSGSNRNRNQRRTQNSTVIVALSRLLRQMKPLVRNIINDHPRRLNVYSYGMVAAFNGKQKHRFIQLESNLFRLILEKHLQTASFRRASSIIHWMWTLAAELLDAHLDRLTFTEQLGLQATLDICERLLDYPASATNDFPFKVHFSVFQSKLATGFDRPCLENGMMLVEQSDIETFCTELFVQLLLTRDRLQITDLSEGSLSVPLKAAVNHCHHKVKKLIDFSRRLRQTSLHQLRKDLPLLPPCIFSLISQLEEKNSLSNNDRFRLIIFLKNIGLPLRHAEKFFRDIYNRNVNPALMWTTGRAGHLRRRFTDPNLTQYACSAFNRYCVWRQGSGMNAKRILAKLRKGQQTLENGLWCSGNEFQSLLASVGKAPNDQVARSKCTTLGCFQGSEIPFFSPLGYYLNTKTYVACDVDIDEGQSDSSFEDDLSW